MGKVGKDGSIEILSDVAAGGVWEEKICELGNLRLEIGEKCRRSKVSISAGGQHERDPLYWREMRYFDIYF